MKRLIRAAQMTSVQSAKTESSWSKTLNNWLLPQTNKGLEPDRTYQEDINSIDASPRTWTPEPHLPVRCCSSTEPPLLNPPGPQKTKLHALLRVQNWLLPGISRGEDGRGAQQFLVQIGSWHRKGCVLGQQHSADGKQSLKHTQTNEAQTTAVWISRITSTPCIRHHYLIRYIPL